MSNRKIHLRLAQLPSGLASFPRLVLTRRPDLLTVAEPPDCAIRVDSVRLDAAQIESYATVCGFDAADVRNGRVPVTYPHVLATPLHLRIMALDSFPLRPLGLIHVSNVIAAPGELLPGKNVDLVVAARNFRKTDAGLVFDLDTEVSRAGVVQWRETCVLMARWPDGAQRSGARPPRPPRAPKGSDVLAEFEVGLATAWRYARVSGDFNPIHLHDRTARLFGLRGAILHGMWSLARSLAAAPAITPDAEARLETQFLTPVQLPGRVSIKQWSEEGVARRALCDVRTGRVHMLACWQA